MGRLVSIVSYSRPSFMTFTSSSRNIREGSFEALIDTVMCAILEVSPRSNEPHISRQSPSAALNYNIYCRSELLMNVHWCKCLLIFESHFIKLWRDMDCYCLTTKRCFPHQCQINIQSTYTCAQRK